MRSRKGGVHAQSYIDVCDLSTLHKFLSQDTNVSTMGTLIRATVKTLLATLEEAGAIERDTDPFTSAQYLSEKGIIKGAINEVIKSSVKKVAVTRDLIEKARTKGTQAAKEPTIMSEEEQESIRRRYNEVFGGD